MGLSESKLISQALEKACRDAETGGKDDIINVLSETEFMNLARRLWACIPLDARRRIGRPPQKGTRNYPRRLNQSKSKITVPPFFLLSIHRWENDPLSFFMESSIELHLAGAVFGQLYAYLEELEQRKQKDIVRSRLMKVLFSRLKERLCLNYVRANDEETVARIISNIGMVSSDPKAIANISKWIKEGGKIDALCKDINTSKSLDDKHLGVLFYLPQDIHSEFIRVIPQDGKDRNKEISHLRDRGILCVDGKEMVDNMASKIFGFLWEKVESSIKGLESELNANWALLQTQAFRTQIAKDSEDGPNAPNYTSPNSEISSSHSASTPTGILATSLPNGDDGPGDQGTDISGPQENENSLLFNLAPCSRDGHSSQIGDIGNSQSRNSRQLTQPIRSMPSHETCTANSTASEHHRNVSSSSAIGSRGRVSIESPNTSTGLEESSRSNLDGDLNQESQPTGGRQFYYLPQDHVVGAIEASYNLLEDGQLLGAQDHAMGGIEVSYNLLQDGQLLGGPQHCALSQDHAMGAIEVSYNLLQDGQLLGGPQHCALSQDHAMGGIEASYNLLEDGQLLGGPQSLPFQHGQSVSAIGTEFSVQRDAQCMVAPQDGQTTTGMDGPMSPILTRDPDRAAQIPFATTPRTFAPPPRGQSFLGPSFSWPVLKT